MFGILKKIFGTAQERRVKQFFQTVKAINAKEEEYRSLSDDALKAKTDEFKKRLEKGEPLDDLLIEAFAVVKNACRRLQGTEVHVSGYDQRWDMVPFDVQLVGAIAMHKGCIAEMMTGEGKTLTAVMPLYLNALSGKPVHLITVNDYLAKRDCDWVGSVLRWLGLSTGALTGDVPTEKRKELYLCDVVYGTASEFGFDYLRDNSMAMSKEQQVQRGYFFAIIDEIDSILIDEARTPLIISGPVPESRQMYDELKGNVETLVRMQRDECSKLASDAFKVLKSAVEAAESEEPIDRKLSKEEKAAEEDAMKTLWLVSKGTPRNRVIKRIMESPDLRAALEKLELYYYSDQNKEEKKEALAKLYIIVDERSSDFELTDRGIAAWAKLKGDANGSDDFTMLDISDEFLRIDEDASLSENEKIQQRLTIQEEDAKRKERVHNLRQLLRAHLLMERDVDYIVQNDKIVIIDENTGRPQPGRRFSDGLHQAIEAKEGVKIQQETQTYATITLQNYFRMYKKLAGMTGTATTEAGEFAEIYKLDVLEIPTNKPCLRIDHNDEIYMSEREKYNAILKEVNEIHQAGRPILIGTDSVQASEKLSRIFKQNQLSHTVLNAKHHEQEAEIIASAGRQGAITIATNMAGRGTDIKLGDDIANKGGLHVLGTTRHQSRRIDRQLGGRCARQGDPGTTKFYVSFEDPLLRLFASPKMTAMLQRFRPPEGEPISASILNRSIKTAQERVEQRNATFRKHTLEYDDVMNKQRQEIYAFRNEVLRTDTIFPITREILETVCSQAADDYFVSRSDEGGWNPEGYREWLMRHFPVSFDADAFDDDYSEIEDFEKLAAEKVINAFESKIGREESKLQTAETENAGQSPNRHITEAIRNLMIRVIDRYWQEHLLRMDHLRTDVNLRAVGQRDPLMEFKQEAFHLFDALGKDLRNEIAHDLFKFEMIPPERVTLEQLFSKLQLERSRSLASDLEENGVTEEESTVSPEPFVASPKVGRNDPCPCGSGQKYKKCCGLKSESESVT